MTTPSPWTLGSVTTRRSTWWPSIARPTRPSCGMRRSAMSRSLMIFMRDTTPATMRRGTVVEVLSTPSMRKRTPISLPSGWKWMSDVPCSTAWAMIWLTSLMTGASSADSRRSTISAGPLAGLLAPPTSSATTSSSRVRRVISAADVLAAGDRRPHLVAGHQRDVVDDEDVAGIGHRDEHRALVDERDRRRRRSAWRSRSS